MAGFALVVACQAAGFHEPAKGAFDYPAPWQQLKTLGLVAAFDDFQGQTAVAEEFPHLPHPSFQFALIAPVGKDQGHVQKQMAEEAKQDFGTIPVLHAGGADVNAQEQPLGIGQEVAFASFDLLACVIAAAAGGHGIGAFDALAVDDGRAGRGVFFSFRRRAGRKASLMRGHKPLADQRVKASWTVDFGGNSEGSIRHWQPVLSR